MNVAKAAELAVEASVGHEEVDVVAHVVVAASAVVS